MTAETWTRSDLAGTNAGLAGPVKMWTPPRPRPYTPKPADPGQRITWTRHEPGHWTELPETWGGRMPDTSKYVQPRDVERAGTIWSAGPRARTVWVQPDDAEPGDMVLVSYTTEHQQRYGGVAAVAEQTGYDRDWQRRIVRVCDNLNAAASLTREYRTRRDYWGGPTDETVAWHTDPDCPAVEHKTGGGYPPAIGDVVRDLLKGSLRTDLCKRCIWLTPAEAVAA